MPQIDNGVACLVLAAGGGSRLGGGKLLLPWRGKPLILHAVETAMRTPGLLSVTVVVGHEACAMRQAIESGLSGRIPRPRIVENARWREGQSASLGFGLESILASLEGDAVKGVLVMLGDQPFVKTETLTRLIGAHAEARGRDPEHPATAPVYRGGRGNPVILSRALFPGVMTLAGDVGARNLLAALGDRLLLVEVEDPGVVHDVDTPEEYANSSESI